MLFKNPDYTGESRYQVVDSSSLNCANVGGFGEWGGGWKGLKVVASDGMLPWNCYTVADVHVN